MRQDRASATALLIALSAVFLSRQPREAALLPPDSAARSEQFLQATAPTALRLVRALAAGPQRVLVQGLERAALPGIQRHYAARKRCIEEAARALLTERGGQLVVLGAGLDTLAVRVAHDLPDVRCVEVDHPATSSVKRRALAADHPENLTLVPLDLGPGSWDKIAEIHRDVPTVVVLEGVTMYLTEVAVQDTLRACARFPVGSQVIWTFMEPDRRGRLRFHRAGRVVDAWLSRQHEPFTWGLPEDAVPDFVGPLGLEIRELVAADELRSRYLDPLGIHGALAEGEAICVCERTS